MAPDAPGLWGSEPIAPWARTSAETAEVLAWVRQRDHLDPQVALDIWSPVLAEKSGWPTFCVHVLTGWTEDWSRSAVVVVETAAEAARLAPGWSELVPDPLDGGIGVYAPVAVMAEVQDVVAGMRGVHVIGYHWDATGQLKHWRDRHPVDGAPAGVPDPWIQDSLPIPGA